MLQEESSRQNIFPVAGIFLSMTISRVCVLFAFLALLPPFSYGNPKVIIKGTDGSADPQQKCQKCVPVGINFNFTSPPSGSGTLYFTNASNKDWISLALIEKVEPPDHAVCGSAFFSSCTVTRLKNGNVEILYSGVGQNYPGITNGQNFTMVFSCVHKVHCWPGGLSFSAHAGTNQKSEARIPQAEPPATDMSYDGPSNNAARMLAGVRGSAVLVNPVANTIYIADPGCIGLQLNCKDEGSVTILRGLTNSVTSVRTSNAKGPTSLAVDRVSNKLYVANYWTSNISIIDGETGSIITVNLPEGLRPLAIDVNSTTNKIYVASQSGGLTRNRGTVVVIDGLTYASTTITDPNALYPRDLAVNPVTNKIYVANSGSNNITVIDGDTNATTTITDPDAVHPVSVAVNTVSNTIYVANTASHSSMSRAGTVTVVNGETNSIAALRAGINPTAVAVNEVSDQVFVANRGYSSLSGNDPGNILQIDGATNSLATVRDSNVLWPIAVAVDPVTNTVYVANIDGTIIVINESELDSP